MVDFKESLRDYVGKSGDQDKPFHPNRISFYGAVLTGAGFVCLANPVSSLASIPLIGAGVGCDIADGAVAREFDLCSSQGAKLDPLFDKIKNFGFVGTVAVFGSLVNPYLAMGSALSLGVDVISQRQRGQFSKQFDEAYGVVIDPNKSTIDSKEDLENKIITGVAKSENLKANVFGKVKTSLQSAVHLGYASMFVFEDEFKEYFNLDSTQIETGLGIALGVSAVCGSYGVYQRLKKNEFVLFPEN
jgi:hypothetical protein